MFTTKLKVHYLSGLKPTDLVNMNVSKFIESLAIKMIGIGTSGNLNISYSPVSFKIWWPA